MTRESAQTESIRRLYKDNCELRRQLAEGDTRGCVDMTEVNEIVDLLNQRYFASQFKDNIFIRAAVMIEKLAGKSDVIPTTHQ